MLDATSKADVLIEAMGWIRRFRGKSTVIKLGGSVMEDDLALRHVLIDMIFMESVGMRPIVVHGAGSAISRAMEASGLTPQFVRGRRITDPATLQIVEKVLAGQVNDAIVQEIQRLGGQARGLSFRTTNVLFGHRLAPHQDQGQWVDLGLVGEVSRVDSATIEQVCRAESIPVIPSMCLDEATGQMLNVNADTAATAVAEALHAEKLVFLSDVNGVRASKEDPDSLVHTLDPRQARAMITSGQIETGMIPKVEACLSTLEHGVGKVHIVDGRLRHSLLLEVYTNKGVGTQFVQDSPIAGGPRGH